MDRYIRKLIDQTAKDCNISKIKAEHIILSQFKFLKKIIEEGDYKSFRIMHLGKFTPSKKRIEQRLKKKRDE